MHFPKKNTLAIKIAFLALSLALFYIFHLSIKSYNAQPISEFDAWVGETVSLTRKGKISAGSLPYLSLEIKQDDGKKKIFSVSGTNNDSKINRLLELARETKLFNLSIESDSKDSHLTASYTVSIKGNGKKFTALFSLEDIKHNIALQNLIKLFEIYGLNIVR